jgi:lipoprotein-anchoring transpeptidase ErfK/SrfK
VKRIVLVVSTLAFAAVVGACSAGTGPSPADAQRAAPAPVTVPTTAPATTAAPTTTTTTTTTTTATPATVRPKTTPKPTTPNAKPIVKAPAGVPCTITSGACVDLSAHKAWLLANGKVIYGPVSALPGGKGHATPVGSFHVLSKEKMHYSREFDNAPMPNSVFFYPGDAFHAGSLSQPSHGCVHLSNAASLKFFTTLHVGDPVQVVR